MKATILLADAATEYPKTGKVDAGGVGWAVTGTPTKPIVLLVFLECPWEEAGEPHELAIDLLNSEGQPVSFELGSTGEPVPAVALTARFAVPRPPDLPPGMSQRRAVAVPITEGMPLAPGESYTFALSIDGDPVDSWGGAFYVKET